MPPQDTARVSRTVSRFLIFVVTVCSCSILYSPLSFSPENHDQWSDYHNISHVSECPRILPSDHYRCIWLLWTCSESFRRLQIWHGRSDWCIDIRGHYYPEFGIIVIEVHTTVGPAGSKGWGMPVLHDQCQKKDVPRITPPVKDFSDVWRTRCSMDNPGKTLPSRNS